MDIEINWPLVSAIAIVFPVLVVWQSKSKRNQFDGSPQVLKKLAMGLAILGILIVAAAGALGAMKLISVDNAFIYGFVCGGMSLFMSVIVFRHYLNATRR